MKDLKLIALDAEDLAVLSAHLQDAVLRVGEMVYQKGERRFAAVLNRFDWERALAEQAPAKGFARRRAGLRFERVSEAKVSGLDPKAKDAVLSLLAIQFEEGIAPGGQITLRFSGGGAVRLAVECIEAELKDLGAQWTTPSKPAHPGGDDGGTS